MRVTPWWILRFGAALCFIGHGAFGFITKAAWVPYFGVVGVPEPWAYQLMPMVGAVDVLAGMAVLFNPTRLPLLYMVIWATWTALLRPLAGESPFETLERAGNIGVPLAMLILAGWPRNWRDLFTSIPQPLTSNPQWPALILRSATVLLLLGHGALGLSAKALLASHYAAVGLPPETQSLVGWFEILLAGLIAFRPVPAVLLFVAVWKLVTESLFLAAGAPVWELVERAGSYAAPLALGLIVSAAASRRVPEPAREVSSGPGTPTPRESAA